MTPFSDNGTAPLEAAAPGAAPAAPFNPFRLLNVDGLDPATLDSYAVFLVGLRRTLRVNAARVAGSAPEPMLREFLDEVEDALRDALAARHRRR